MTLTEHETEALAVLLIARQLQDSYAWLAWEDLPELDQAAFEALAERIHEQGRCMASWLSGYEVDHDVDARDIERRAT